MAFDSENSVDEEDVANAFVRNYSEGIKTQVPNLKPRLFAWYAGYPPIGGWQPPAYGRSICVREREVLK